MEAPSESEVLSWFERYSNWGRWGPDDVSGTRKLIGTDRLLAAVASVARGFSVSCAWDLDAEREMLATGHTPTPQGQRWGGAAERIGVAYHGYLATHLDALSHYSWDGRMYNNRAATDVDDEHGARQLAVTDAAAGIVGRGVLLDVAAHRGVDWLAPGEAVFPDELDAVARGQGVTVGPGDIVLLRTGYGRKVREHGRDDVGQVGRAGWHAACIPWFHDHDIAAIGADTAQDAHPSGYAAMRSPIHAIGIVAMGLWLIDNCDLEGLSATCAMERRWHFLLHVAPLRVVGGTGSPVNPLATF